MHGVSLSLVTPDGNTVTFDASNDSGNVFSTIALTGVFQYRIGEIQSRTWHSVPAQKDCNACHMPGANAGGTRNKRFPLTHTAIPADNDCANCHHFPASMSLTQLVSSGVLTPQRTLPSTQNSMIRIAGKTFTFDPSEHTISTVRPDIFAPGYFSMFDAVLAVAQKNNIPIEYTFDDSSQTHFITKLNGVPGQYWYHFSYDAGNGNSAEIQYRRANRWDEALWRKGVWINVVDGEDVDGLRREYREEVARERQYGHMIPSVQISVNPSSYQGNPPGSDRVTVSKNFTNVIVSPHNLRATGTATPYSKPFKPGVVTSIDIPLSLVDQGKLTAATGVFYNYFGTNFIDSYYLVEMGFPGVGTAHSSGRQGFTYVTENGVSGKLPNSADNKMHITSDIHVVHAPDFSTWRWTELGNPYYENREPTTGVTDPLIDEDDASISRGFNLHPPGPNPCTDMLAIRYNIFHPGLATILLFDGLGRQIVMLSDGLEQQLGFHELHFDAASLRPGAYFIVMHFDGHVQERRFTVIR